MTTKGVISRGTLLPLGLVITVCIGIGAGVRAYDRLESEVQAEKQARTAVAENHQGQIDELKVLVKDQITSTNRLTTQVAELVGEMRGRNDQRGK